MRWPHWPPFPPSPQRPATCSSTAISTPPCCNRPWPPGLCIGNLHLTTLDKGAFGDDGAQWHEAVIDFTAYSNLSVFSIAAAGVSDSYGTSFDNFSAVAVPEPASLGLFAAGLAMLGLTARRRRQQ